MKNISLILVAVLSISTLAVEAQRRSRSKLQTTQPNWNPDIFQGLKWRNIGPHRGGRANSITGVVGNDRIYYAGYTGGGVWKTEDAGYNWKNISDGFFKVGSIGDIGVSESDPNVIYVGTGEHAVRGVMTSYGDGIYKSVDAGKTWTNIGLEKTRHISDVVIHPTNPDIVFIGAQGAVHGPSPDRGLYKSTDGGKTWKKTLYVDENTGVSSVSMDMTNPRILYAATWQHRRYPWKVESGGPGSSVYKSTDSGETWTKITKGLPEEMGKIGISVSRANPNRVFTLVESEKSKSGLYRSDDGGMNWKLMSNNQIITARSWYYMEVFADPNDENVVYALNAPLMRSIDGGKTFENMRVIHGDCHELYINPTNSNNIAMAEDGGGTISFDKGKVWSTLNNQATAQFYRITADKQMPFWVYGGQQDNMSVAIPTRTNGYGIISKDWFNGPGCESAAVAFDDPSNPRVLYGDCFNGRISLLDIKTMEGKDIMPYPMTNLGYEAKDMKYRFNWNAPLINSPHNPKVMYYGGNVLFKSTNGGLKWEPISPDLTRDEEDKQREGGGPFTNEGAGGENYNTIYYVAESPHQEGVIYTGSDGGLMHVTRDGGKNWTNITPAGLPETMIHSIEVSPHDPATVYFASTRYKFNDYKNYSYKSSDYGATWKKIGDDIGKDDFFKVIREDAKVKDILYAGAERGFYISFDGGTSFKKLQLNLPVVPITDMVTRDNDLAIATAGRSFWVLDDVSALQQSKGDFSGKKMSLYEPKAHYRIFAAPPFFLITEHAFGQNPAEGVHLDYYLENFSKGDSLKLEILDEQDEVIRSFDELLDGSGSASQGGRGNLAAANTEKLPIEKGINRFTWNFRTKAIPKVPDVFVLGGDYRGHRVAPGSYKARMTYGEIISEVSIEILPPPNINVDDQQWQNQQELMQQIEDQIAEMHQSINTSIKIGKQIQSIKEQYKSEENVEDLIEVGDALKKKIDDWEGKMIEKRQTGFQDALNWPAGLNSEFFYIRNNLDTYDPKIPDGYKVRFQDLGEQWREYQKIYQEIINKDVKEFNDLFQQKGIPALAVPKDDKPLNN